MQEFIKNDIIGRVVDRNEKEFAIAIKDILKMNNKEKTVNMCREIAMEFSFEKTAQKTIDVYKNLYYENFNRY